MSSQHAPSQHVDTDRLARWFGVIRDLCLYGILFFVPLIAMSGTIDRIELPKQTLLGVLVVIALFAWCGKALTERVMHLPRAWMHGIVACFAGAFLLSSLFSIDRYLSFVGQLGLLSWSFATISLLLIAYILFAERFRTAESVWNALLVFLASSLVVACQTLWHISRHDQGNPIGSIFALTSYLVVPLVVSVAIAFHGCKNKACLIGTDTWVGTVSRGIVWLAMAACASVLIFIGLKAAWIAVLCGMILLVAIGVIRARAVHKHPRVALPIVLILASLAFLLFPLPWRSSLPTEVSLSAKASWMIARKALQAHPLLGSGPSTWVHDYAKYRPAVLNLSPFWNTRFDRGFSAFLTLIPSIGLVGAILWLFLLIGAGVSVSHHLFTDRNEDRWLAYLMVSSGWFTLAIMGFFYNYNMAHQVIFWVFLGILTGLRARHTISWPIIYSHPSGWIASIKTIVIAVGGISLLWLGAQRFSAERAFANAFEGFQTHKPIEEVVSLLTRSVEANPWSDLYARSLSQAYGVLVAEKLAARTADDPARAVGHETSLAVDYGLKAVERAPANVENWANIAHIYREIGAFTKGADVFAAKNYEEAHARDPQNPIFLDELGTLALLRADALRTALAAKNGAGSNDGSDDAKLALIEAERWLKEAITAKPDYLPARYHLGVVYERQGRLAFAIQELEQIYASRQSDPDAAFELAVLYYRNRNTEKARKLLEETVRLDGSRANARWYLAAMYDEAGETQKAIEQVREVKKLLPENTAVEERLRMLESRARGDAIRPERGLPEPLLDQPVAQNLGQ